MADSKISALTDGTTPATTDASPWARSGGTTVKLTWAELTAAMPGHEIGYDQITASVTVVSTTEASGTTIITCSAHTFDGAPVIAEFFCGSVLEPSGNFVIVSLFESSTQITRLGSSGSTTSLANDIHTMTAKYRFTPTAGSHTYLVTANMSGGSGAAFQAGAGGTATTAPAYIRFTKA